MTTRIRRWLEPLEDRTVPAVDIFAQGSTLFVLGDRLANDVQLTRDADVVRVTADNQRTQSFAGITAVYADLRDGNDRLTATLRPGDYKGTPPPDPWRLTAFLGAGNDSFAVTIPPPDPSAPGADLGGLEIVCDGEAGNDSAFARVAFNPQPEPPKFRHLGFDFDGGTGDDFLGVDVQNATITGELAMSADGGTGGDEVGIIIINSRIGALEQIVDGGGGDDRITARMGIGPVPFTPAARFNCAIDGGAGHDLFDVEVSGEPVPNDGMPPPIGLTVDGGVGNDRATVRLQKVNLADGGVLVDMGRGDDSLLFEGGEIRSLHGGIRLDTAAGDDTVSARFVRVATAGAPVFVSTGDGDDVLDGSSEAADLPFAYIVDLGAGDDSFTQIATFAPTDAGRIRGAISVSGGVGDDRIVLLVRLAPGTPPRGGTEVDLDVTVDGGTGDDALFVFGSVLGSTASLTGTIDVDVLGGTGNDHLWVLWPSFGPTVVFDAVADGGAGFDIGVTSPSVTRVGIEF